MSEPVFAVIGGSGLYDWAAAEERQTCEVETPFGPPSAPIARATVAGRACLFLPRHGPHHTLLPHEVPARANIFALKQLGATHVFSVSAVGSLQEQIAPGHLVLPDQYIDRTLQRPSTFFGQGLVAHVAFADPICPDLLARLARAGEAEGLPTHVGGTYVCMEGPQFSTRAESRLHRSWGAAVIGMTNLPEAKLAREAELHYAVLAFPSDYDCWKPDEEHVSVDNILALLKRNAAAAQRVIGRALEAWDTAEPRPCDCGRALHRGLMTPLERLAPANRALLAVLAPDLIKP